MKSAKNLGKSLLRQKKWAKIHFSKKKSDIVKPFTPLNQKKSAFTNKPPTTPHPTPKFFTSTSGWCCEIWSLSKTSCSGQFWFNHNIFQTICFHTKKMVCWVYNLSCTKDGAHVTFLFLANMYISANNLVFFITHNFDNTSDFKQEEIFHSKILH